MLVGPGLTVASLRTGAMRPIPGSVLILAAAASAQDLPRPRPAPRKPQSDTARAVEKAPEPARQATLVLSCDAPCDLKLNDLELGSLEADQPKRVSVEPGQHLLI